MSIRFVPVLLVAAGAACAPALASHQESASPLRHLTRDQRVDAIRRADVWKATPVASMDLRAGPQGEGAYAPFATVSCDYVDQKLSGSSAKFDCAVAPGDVVKVKYGQDNVEVYAEVAATRLLWALGFGSDRWYPVTVVCRGCPSDPHHDRTQRPGEVTFDVAAIERKMPGKTMEAKPDEGWKWSEFDLVGEANGAEQRMHRDALKLLAVFLQHTDSKPIQQRLICLPHESPGEGSEGCREPFMLIHDVGLTFGRANLRNANQASGANFDRWAAIPVWKDAKKCVGKLSGSFTGTLADPVISEPGRKFLSDLLAQLSDDQLRDMFEVARFSLHSNVPTSQWVDLFKKKRQEIAEVTCSQP
jgi:hypothetical protein